MAKAGHRCGLKLLSMLVTCLATVGSRSAASHAGDVLPLATRHVDQHSTAATSSPDSVCVKADLCTCSLTTADCSHHYGRLTYIPALPEGIKHVIFSYNNLTTISSDVFFSNVTRIESLDLQHNGLRQVNPGAFTGLKRLQVLTLDYNHLAYSDLNALLLGSRISSISLRYMGLGPLEFVFGKLISRCLSKIDLSGNLINHLNLSMFEPLLRLYKLRVMYSDISAITPGFLPQLISLDLSHNGIFYFSETCRNGTALFPRLQSLTVKGNSISDIPPKVCLPKLQNLDLNGNHISQIKTDTFSGRQFPSLATLGLQSIQPMKRIERYAFRNPTLEKLTLMYCNIDFAKDVIDPHCFAGLPKLKMLQVSHNLGFRTPDRKFKQLFGSLTNIEELHLGSCEWGFINKDAFSNLTRLTSLYLHRSAFTGLPGGTFDSLLNLTTLDLSNNQITTIPETLFSPATRKRLHHLDLSGNPFVCGCDLLWFRDWFVSSPSLFRQSYVNYTCSNLVKGTQLGRFSLRTQVCLLSRPASYLIITCVLLLVTVLTAVSACYQYRWHIRLLLYESFRGRGEGRRRRRLETGAFDFDVFVCYAHPDLWWVRAHLVPRLEERMGLKLCIHERDFLPGNNIVDNIMESVQGSKKMMMVFSKDFVDSHWCQFELALCLQHVIETDDALIVACLEDVTSLNMTTAMMAVLKTTTYIQWDENPDAVASFWGRLEQALGEVLPGDV